MSYGALEQLSRALKRLVRGVRIALWWMGYGGESPADAPPFRLIDDATAWVFRNRSSLLRPPLTGGGRKPMSIFSLAANVTRLLSHLASSSNRALASFKSSVSKPSVNQP